jgi:hypothetical protein
VRAARSARGRLGSALHANLCERGAAPRSHEASGPLEGIPMPAAAGLSVPPGPQCFRALSCVVLQCFRALSCVEKGEPEADERRFHREMNYTGSRQL